MPFYNLSISTKLLFTLLLCSFLNEGFTQQSMFNFAELSSVKYKEKISQLEKYKAPVKYAEKSAQAWCEEMLTDRNKSLLHAFKKNEIIHDTMLLNKCNAIFSRIKGANKNLWLDTIQLYINRSMVANAACYGEGTIMINLGLFLWVDNDDELAMVLGHEIAHQVLNHVNGQMDKSIKMLTSDEFKEELKDIKKADYGKFDRFRKLMKGIKIESGKHSTYKESEADSLGVVLIKNANYDINKGAKILLKLDHVEDLAKSNKLYVTKDFFVKTGINLSYFNIKPKYNGLSSATVTMNADKDIDSIKTHPDCIKRYEIIAGKNTPETPNCCSSLNSMYAQYKEQAMLEIVRYLYETNTLGWCTHLCIFALQNNYNPVIYNNFLSLCFSKMYYNDTHLQRFNSVNAGAEKETNLKELQDFLFAVNNSDIETLATYFLNQKNDANSEDFQFASLMYNTQIKQKPAETLSTDFINKFPKTKYQYLIQNKEK